MGELSYYRVEVVEVHSGDDLVLLVDLGVDNLFKRVRARLYGVDTPDAYKAGSDTPAGMIRDQVKTLVKNKRCGIHVHSQNSGKSGWVVTLHLGAEPQAPTLNDLLKSEGYVFS